VENKLDAIHGHFNKLINRPQSEPENKDESYQKMNEMTPVPKGNWKRTASEDVLPEHGKENEF
jgi:hypothetical protein